MSRKKIFGVSAELNRGFSETIALIENNEGKFRNAILALSKIELDPDNPRKLSFNLQDAINGLDKNDPQYDIKYAEQEKLYELAETIKSSGIINPIVVYKYNEFYRVVAGERRCLASILAGKSEIDARVFNDRPKPYSLKLLQWVENTAREDLSLLERIDNIKDIYVEYKKQNPTSALTAGLLEKITGLSNARASQYCSAINAPINVTEAIHQGKINSLEKAVLIGNIEQDELRAQILQECLDGTSLTRLKSLIKAQKFIFKSTRIEKKLGRTPKKVNFGVTNKLEVAQSIIEVILESRRFKHLGTIIKMNELRQVSDASKTFKKMIKLIENEV